MRRPGLAERAEREAAGSARQRAPADGGVGHALCTAACAGWGCLPSGRSVPGSPWLAAQLMTRLSRKARPASPCLVICYRAAREQDAFAAGLFFFAPPLERGALRAAASACGFGKHGSSFSFTFIRSGPGCFVAAFRRGDAGTTVPGGWPASASFRGGCMLHARIRKRA